MLKPYGLNSETSAPWHLTVSSNQDSHSGFMENNLQRSSYNDTRNKLRSINLRDLRHTHLEEARPYRIKHAWSAEWRQVSTRPSCWWTHSPTRNVNSRSPSIEQHKMLSAVISAAISTVIPMHLKPSLYPKPSYPKAVSGPTQWVQ